jgi:hypothetical protein
MSRRAGKDAPRAKGALALCQASPILESRPSASQDLAIEGEPQPARPTYSPRAGASMTRRLVMNSIVALPIAAAVPVASPAMSSAQPPDTDRRALEAYASWLFMERRILCGELWPHIGAKAERYDLYDNAGAGWHFRGDGDWRDLPQPSSRAAAVLDLVEVDWRQPKEDLGLNHDDNGARPPLPARWPEVDGELTDAYEQIVSLDAKISVFCDTISDDDRETHQGYQDAEDARFEAIDRLIEIPARTWKGIKAKASALNMRQILDDPERSRGLGESLADDVLQLSVMMGA